MDQSTLPWMDAVDVASAVSSGDLTPTELVESSLTRIAERNRTLGAVVHLAADEARQSAVAAEKALATGPTGPLTGVPILMKDLFDFKPGWPSTLGGIRALSSNIASHRCLFVERMEAAGAIIIGKTNSPVLGARGTTDNPLFGPTCNPFSPQHNAGGSSGGSAAAVADGMVSIAEGTDAGGSIRIPAAWTSTYGFKPSAGRVPSIVRPLGFLNSAPFITEGPITRTVRDAALAMHVLGGSDPRAPWSLDGSVDYMAATRRDVRGLRVGLSVDLGVFQVDSSVAAMVLECAAALEDAGAVIVPVAPRLPAGHEELAQLWHRSMLQVTVSSLEALRADGVDLLSDLERNFPAALVAQLEQASSISALQLRRDDQLRTEVFDSITDAFATVDALVTATVGSTAVHNRVDGETMGPTEIAGKTVEPLIGWALTFPFNFTGHPAASVPAGLVDGLPVGLQIVGRLHRDDDVLALSAAIERFRPWSGHYELCERRLSIS